MPSLETCSIGTMGSSNKWKPGDTPELGILHAPLGYPLPGLKNKTQSQDSRKTGQEYFPSVQVPSGRHFSLFPLTKATFPLSSLCWRNREAHVQTALPAESY